MRSPPPSRKEGAAAEGLRRKEASRGEAVGRLKKRAKNEGANGAGGVSRSSLPTARTGVARNGAVGVGSGAGAQHAVPPQEQQRHGVGARAWPEVVGVMALEGDAMTACTRKARSRTRALRDRVTVGESGESGYFLVSSSSFLENFAVSFLKSLRQLLQQNMYSRPSATAPTAWSSSSFSPETMQVVSG